MRLFGRKSDPASEPSDGIEEFWSWWPEARPELDAMVAAGEADRLAEWLGPAVQVVHPSLVWEIAPGRTADQALVVTAAGDPELRAVAHRWAAAAPPADALWEFHPSRQANPDAVGLTLDVGGYGFALDKLVLGLRAPHGNPRVDVVAHHPIFGALDEETRTEATLLALDWLLGEDDVARWLGEISAVEFPPIDAVPAVHLPSVVADLAADFREEQWALLEGETGTGARLIATARYPLRPVDYPLFDQHIAITLPYLHRDPDGLPTGPSLEALRDFEERLAGRISKLNGTAVLAAHMSAEGQRVLHVYADPAGEAAIHAKELIISWEEGRPRVDVAGDPAWTAVAPFLS
ncbi:hypothetical protein GCM10010156_16220 [Planobispora rosea]|uniref:DUF695 domain-containing protein n=1 Tax=Planobispora rosea TaxID=35762 RepID=A0A8J3WCB6_PLARO|nr:DUF695 domain-containing protein [Planobispora rosea]GGS58321.1 hypothetical protein GCM10010156_16220 [Planobispora rosea]GIH84769.1 hypothetical protein Pro02_31770 [Planobispora rosea]